MRIIKNNSRRNYAPKKRDIYGTITKDRQIVKKHLKEVKNARITENTNH